MLSHALLCTLIVMHVNFLFMLYPKIHCLKSLLSRTCMSNESPIVLEHFSVRCHFLRSVCRDIKLAIMKVKITGCEGIETLKSKDTCQGHRTRTPSVLVNMHLASSSLEINYSKGANDDNHCTHVLLICVCTLRVCVPKLVCLSTKVSL